jgi:hypothetical protein
MNQSQRDQIRSAVEKLAAARLETFRVEVGPITELFGTGNSEDLQNGLDKCKEQITIHHTEITRLLKQQIENNPNDCAAILDFARRLGDTDPCTSVQLLGELSSELSDIETILEGIGFSGGTRSTPEGKISSDYTFQEAWSSAWRIARRSDDLESLGRLHNKLGQVGSSLEAIVNSISPEAEGTKWEEISTDTLKPLYDILEQPLFDVSLHSKVQKEIQDFLNQQKNNDCAATLRCYVLDILEYRLSELQPLMNPIQLSLFE